MADVLMPQLGETVTEGTITRWFKQPGETVEVDEVLFEVSTDKVDSEVPSPLAGVLAEIVVPVGATVDVGQVLAVVTVADQGSAQVVGAPGASPASQPAPAAPAHQAARQPEPSPVPDGSPASAASVQAPASPVRQPDPVAEASQAAATAQSQGVLLSPVVRRLVADSGIDISAVAGTGVGGRITRSDVEKAISAQRSSGAAVSQSAPATAASPVTAPSPATSPAPAPAASGDGPASAALEAVASTSLTAVVAPLPANARDTVVALNRIRATTGDYMVDSKRVSPHVLTAIEVDYENVERVRQANKAQFKSEEGFSLTYLPFISRALVDALRDFPHMNASMGDNELVVHGAVNLAIAVDLNFEGLLAPVIHDADGMRMRAIARGIVDVATRARAKKLNADDITRGTFTITNAGQYGTMMQFPIINQPQVAILSTDGISRKPVVVADDHGNESIAIHSVGVLALAWDHRAFDGAYAAAFLAKLKEIIETRDWEAELQ